METTAAAAVGPDDMDWIVYLTTYMTDDSLFSAGLRVAEDQSLSEAARIQGIRVAYMQLFPGTFEHYETFVTDSSVAGIRKEHPPAYTPITNGHARAEASMRILVSGAGPLSIAARRLLYEVIVAQECPGDLDTECFADALAEFEPN